MISVVPSNPKHLMILWFSDDNKLIYGMIPHNLIYIYMDKY